MNKRTITRLEKAAKRGAEYLDTRRPSWFTKINTKKLDLSNCHVCVLGQLYGTSADDSWAYFRGLQLLNGAVAKNPAKFGFDLTEAEELSEYESDYWKKLTALWDAEVALRRKARRAVAA